MFFRLRGLRGLEGSVRYDLKDSYGLQFIKDLLDLVKFTRQTWPTKTAWKYYGLCGTQPWERGSYLFHASRLDHAEIRKSSLRIAVRIRAGGL